MQPQRDSGYETAQHIVKNHICPECRGKSRLVVRWNGKQDEAVCHRCGRTDGFIRRESITAQWRRDPDSVPTEIKNKLEQKYGVEAMTTTALATLGEQGLMERMQQARWTQSLSVQDRKDLARLAIEMNLDPTMGEITIYEGKPYVTLSGYIRTAHNTNMFEGVEDRPMTQEERELYGITQPVGWIAKVYRRNFRVPSTGTGSADPDKPHRNNPIEKAKPQWMARSRAIRQALKLAFPNETPFARITAVGSADDLGIDPETGEILGTHAEPVQIHVVEPFEAGDFTEDDAPADLIAIETPEPQDEAAAKEDLRMKIMAIASRRSLTPAQVEKWCQKHHGKSFDDESVDGLIALAEALQAQKAS